MGFIFTCLLALSLQGCQKASPSDLTDDAQALSEAFADLDDSASPTLRSLIGRGAIVRSSGAVSCTTAYFSACDNSTGTRVRRFDSCSRAESLWQGSVTLSYSNSSCEMDADDSVTRTVSNLVVTGPAGGNIAVNTDATTAYDGTEIQGGQKLTRITDGYSFEVLGVNRVGTYPNGTTAFNISRKTTAPILFTGSSRADRVVQEGGIKTYHNLAKYSVSWVLSDIRWSASCRCPVAGVASGTDDIKAGANILAYNS